MPPDPEVGRRFESHSRNRGMLREVTLLGPGAPPSSSAGRFTTSWPACAGWRGSSGSPGSAFSPPGMVGGWWLSSRAVRPIVAMSETVSGINASNLSRRLDLEGVDTELGQLGRLDQHDARTARAVVSSNKRGSRPTRRTSCERPWP